MSECITVLDTYPKFNVRRGKALSCGGGEFKPGAVLPLGANVGRKIFVGSSPDWEHILDLLTTPVDGSNIIHSVSQLLADGNAEDAIFIEKRLVA